MSNSTRSLRLQRALRRAHARRREGGAVIFVVATTLGVLAVMGVYALGATTDDIHAAGNMRQAIQAQQVGDFGAAAVADWVSYDNADNIVNTRMLNPSTNTSSSDQNCLSTQRNIASVAGSNRTKACVRVSKLELQKTWQNREAFTSQSFGDVNMTGDVYLELTNPTQAPAPPGYDVNLRLKFAMVTVTSFGIVKRAGTTRQETMQMGRGRFVIGPVSQ